MADVTAASKAVATLPALWARCKTIFEAFCDNLVHQTWSKRAAKGKAGAPPNIWNGCTKQNTWKQITQYLLHCGTVLFAILALLLFVLALQVHATDQTQCNASEIKQRRYWSSCLFSPSYYHGCFYAFSTMGKKTPTHEYAFHTIFVPRTVFNSTDEPVCKYWHANFQLEDREQIRFQPSHFASDWRYSDGFSGPRVLTDILLVSFNFWALSFCIPCRHDASSLKNVVSHIIFCQIACTYTKDNSNPHQKPRYVTNTSMFW